MTARNPNVHYRKTCETCEIALSGQKRRFCSDKCRAVLIRRGYDAERKARACVYQRAYRAAHPDKVVAERLAARYRLARGEYEARRQAQGHCCAICKLPERAAVNQGKLSVDHNHRTGAVRGLLCVRCNITLGVVEATGTLKRRPEMLPAFLAYISNDGVSS